MGHQIRLWVLTVSYRPPFCRGHEFARKDDVGRSFVDAFQCSFKPESVMKVKGRAISTMRHADWNHLKTHSGQKCYIIHVSGINRNLCVRYGPGHHWLGNLDSNQDRRSQSPLFYR